MHDAKLCCELGRMYKYHKYFNALLFKAQVSYSVPTVGGRFGNLAICLKCQPSKSLANKVLTIPDKVTISCHNQT